MVQNLLEQGEFFSSLLVALASASAETAAQEGGGIRGYYRYPTIHGDTIVFAAEGDLWRVPLEGGVARRLTTGLEAETHAALSPDGSTLAFSASYEGPREIYTMPMSGGLPTRQTWEGGTARVMGWTPEGRLLYATQGYSTLPNWQLAILTPGTPTPELVPLAQAADGSYDPVTGTLFFARLAFQGRHTKRYQGGTAETLWRFDGPGREAELLTAEYPGTSKRRMFWEGRVYFASDRDGTMNLWSMSPDGEGLRQHTAHDFWEVKSPSLQDGRIVYQLGANIRLYDIASGSDRQIPIRIASDLEQMREQWVNEPAGWVSAAHVSPGGDRLVLVARGEVFVMPTKRGQGRQVRVTRRPSVRYRGARFMPGGESLVALSDETGEVELWRLPADGIGDPEQLTDDSKVLRWDAVPSPDGDKIAHDNKDQELYVYDVDTGASTLVERSDAFGIGSYAWSPDSRWLAYVSSAANQMSQIWLYDAESGSRTPVTTDRFNSYDPAWDAAGEFLYLLSDRNLTSIVGSPWGQRQPEPFIDRPTPLYQVALRDGLRSPFRPDDELATKAGDDEDEPEDDGDSSIRIDLDGLATRLYELPVEPGNYFGLESNGRRLFFGDRDWSPRRQSHLKALEIGNQEPEIETLVEGIRYFELSPDRSKVMVWQGNNFHVFGTAGKPDLGDSRVDLGDWKFSLDPREEWRQMFVEAWRLERDYFYDRGMHGIDWQSMVERYLPLVNRVTNRGELADLIAQMVSELSALHIFVRGGDQRQGEDTITPGSLGAALSWDEAARGYRIDHIYANDPDRPQELSPLARPGVGVQEGDVIRALDGVFLDTVADIRALLRNTAGKQVRLHVHRPGGDQFDTIVVPFGQRAASDLRYDEWEYTRRLATEEMGQDRIGYLHLRAMGRGNWEEWARNYYPVFNREGLIIDVRHNRGGNIDSWILEKLMRKAWFYWAPRVGQPYWNMQYAFRGHMIVLVNERTASDGEAFAEGFRRLGLGSVLGTRTWGGEIWLSSSNFLVDRGIATAAEMGVYGPEGDWLIEGCGVEPDIVVDNLPHATFNGRDAQLEAAVEYLLRKIEEEPVPVPGIPAGPDKSHPNNRRQQ